MARRLSLLLGKCVPSVKPDSSKICITKLELDENLLMYFRKLTYVYAHDPRKICKTGDIVLVEKLPEKMTKLITHRVREVVYPLGDLVDPITGLKVSGTSFRDDIVEESKIFGRNERAFDYDKAPPRGWQEGIKDFSDKPTYIKYHEEPGDDQPYGV